MAEVMGPEIVSGDFPISAIAYRVQRVFNKKLASDCIHRVAKERQIGDLWARPSKYSGRMLRYFVRPTAVTKAKKRDKVSNLTTTSTMSI